MKTSESSDSTQQHYEGAHWADRVCKGYRYTLAHPNPKP